MKRILNRLKPYSAITALLGGVILAAGGLVRVFLPELRSSMIGLLILGVVLVLLSVIGASRELGTAVAGRKGKYGANVVVMISALFGILILLNLLAAASHLRFDLTAADQFTLAPQTKNVLRELREAVKVTGFFPNVPYYEAARLAAEDLLAEYHYHSGHIRYEFVDPEVRPALARDYGIKRYGTIVFESGNRQAVVNHIDEYAFTSAILAVTGRKQKKVYFLTGHGERNIEDTGKQGYKRAKSGLIKELYQVESLNLALRPEIPQDCAVLIIAGPQKPLPRAEQTAVRNFLKQGGKALVLIDPNPVKEMEGILADYALAIGRGAIIDESHHLASDRATPYVLPGKTFPEGQYFPIDLTRDLDFTYFPGAAAVELSPEAARALDMNPAHWWARGRLEYQNAGLLPIAITTPKSWLEVNPEEPRFDENLDTRGPLVLGCLAVAVPARDQAETPKPRDEKKLTRLVVIGDSDFASNEHYPNGGNSDLFLNSVGWLAEEEQLVYIRPKPYTFRRLVASPAQWRFIRFSSLGFPSLPVLLLAAILWWRRR